MNINISNLNEILNSWSWKDQKISNVIFPYEYESIASRMRADEYENPQEFFAREDQDFFHAIERYKNTSDSAAYSNYKPLEDSPYFVATPSCSRLDLYLLPRESGKWL